MVLSQVSTIPATKLKTMKKKWICYATLASWILSLQLLQNSYMTWSQQNFSPMLTDHMLCMFCIQPELPDTLNTHSYNCNLMGTGARNRKSTVNI